MMRALNPSRKMLLHVVGLVAVSVPVIGQVPDASGPQFTFAVATIRRSPPDAHMMMDPNGSAEDFRAAMATVESLIGFAYGIQYSLMLSFGPSSPFNPRSPNLLGGPGWVATDAYDLTAKADEATVEAWNKLPQKEQREQLRKMLQALLAERFHLTVRHETRVLPVWALVIAKGGPKLTPAPPFRPNDPSGQYMSPWKLGDGQIGGKGVSIGALADMLWREREIQSRKVLDQTGLQGTFDFNLKWTPVDDASGGVGPSLFTAIQEQLGLKLESTKAPQDVLVIDHIERPTEN